MKAQTITGRCVAYLRDALNKAAIGYSEIKELLKDRLFLHYAVEELGHHILDVDDSEARQLLDSLLESRVRMELFMNVQHYLTTNMREADIFPENRSLKHAAAMIGHIGFMKEVLGISMNVDIDAPQDILFSTDGLASSKGQISKDLAAADSFGRTPLHYAALYGHLHVIQSLVNIGADVRAEANGNTLIDMVANSATPEILSFLIARGSKPSDPSLYLKAYASLPKVPNSSTNI